MTDAEVHAWLDRHAPDRPKLVKVLGEVLDTLAVLAGVAKAYEGGAFDACPVDDGRPLILVAGLAESSPPAFPTWPTMGGCRRAAELLGARPAGQPPAPPSG